MTNSGKLIVIDGTDGSGKATQTKRLIERLENEGFRVKTTSFPRYGEKSCGLVEEYLEGKYGTADKINPYQGSIFYAVDRYAASFEIRKWLEEGFIVIIDRYVGSNMGHQGGKIHNKEEREKFYKWEMELEHELFGIPIPDANLVLYVPPEISIALAQTRNASEGNKHNLKTDIHEADEQHLRDAAEAYKHMTELFDTFTLVNCTQNGKLHDRDTIHEMVWQHIKPLVTSS
jgi:dTMP kinase